MREDQAMGLRRLFGAADPLTIGVVGHASSTLAIDLAFALARQQHRVLILDGGRTELTRALGVRARFDLLQVLHGDRPLSAALLPVADDIAVLPARRALEALQARDVDATRAWRQFASSLRGYDMRVCHGAPWGLADDAQWLLALAPTATSITAAYARLKELARHGRRGRCRVLIDRARTERAALDAFASVSATAHRFLGIELELCGAIVDAERTRRRAGACDRLARSLAEPAPVQRAVNL
ncbi:MAG TPA: hypothetical protein VMV45_16155 [Casimicrobiaceae bacterium]|nr:hypothetical protein [Casimicrobiaceae bacterium]